MRDSITLGVALLVMLILAGYAKSLGAMAMPMGVLDQDRSPASRATVRYILVREAFTLAGYPTKESAGGRSAATRAAPDRSSHRGEL